MRIVVSIKRCKHDSCKPEKKDKMENAFGRKRNCIREALKGRDMSSMLNERVWNSNRRRLHAGKTPHRLFSVLCFSVRSSGSSTSSKCSI